MSKKWIQINSTSQIIQFFVQNNSVTTGAGLTGLAFNTAGLTAYYYKDGVSGGTQISLVTATQGTYTSSGFIVVDATNAPGLYELGIPNAALTSAGSIRIFLQGAANMAPVVIEIEVTAVNNQSTGFGLVNASANAVQFAGQTITAGAGVTIPSSVASPTNITAGTITTVTNLTNAPTAGDFTSTMKTSIGTAVAASAVASVTAPVGITSNRKKGSTATFEFLMQNSSTGAPQTGLTVASKISKDGGAAANTSNAVTEIGLGQYQLVLTGTEMTANNIFMQFTATGALTSNISIQTQP